MYFLIFSRSSSKFSAMLTSFSVRSSNLVSRDVNNCLDSLSVFIDFATPSVFSKHSLYSSADNVSLEISISYFSRKAKFSMGSSCSVTFSHFV